MSWSLEYHHSETLLLISWWRMYEGKKSHWNTVFTRSTVLSSSGLVLYIYIFNLKSRLSIPLFIIIAYTLYDSESAMTSEVLPHNNSITVSHQHSSAYWIIWWSVRYAQWGTASCNNPKCSTSPPLLGILIISHWIGAESTSFSGYEIILLAYTFSCVVPNGLL
jgi:hypothetical protein